jgi:hypothetical protein
VFPPVIPLALPAADEQQGLIEKSILVDMDRAHMHCILIRYRRTLYSISSHTAAIHKSFTVFPPVILLALPNVDEQQQELIGESILVDMDRAHMHCILIRYRRTLYSISSHIATIDKSITIFPPIMLLAVPAVDEQQQELIEESFLVDMDRARMHCILI